MNLASGKKNILIIDDEQVVIDSISKIAGESNFSFESVLDAQSALQKFPRQNLILLFAI